MNNELSIIATKNFNGVEFNCYKADGSNNDGDFWATREQIGQLLEYVDPRIAITKIHQRNADRLDKFSTVTKLTTVEGSRTVTREVIVYNFKGLLEICRFSNQPKANDVMDFLWDIADEIRRNGFYVAPGKEKQALKYLSRGNFRAMSRIFNLVFDKKGKEIDETEAQKVLALDKVFEATTGTSALEIAGISLKQKTEVIKHRVTLPDGTKADWPIGTRNYYCWEDNLIRDYFGDR